MWGRLIKQTKLEVYRIYKGEYDEITGLYKEGVVRRIEVSGSYPQRAKQNVLLTLPESVRSRETIRVFSHDLLRMTREGDDGYEADVIVYNDDEYEVVRCYPRLVGHLNHYEVIACRKPIAPDKRIKEARLAYGKQQ